MYDTNMYRSSSTRIFPIILIIVIVIALIAGIVTVGNYIFGGGNKDADQQKTHAETARDELLKVDADRSVRMTIRGPIVANETFRSYQVTISPAQREYVVYKGYLEDVKSRKTFSNNTEAYEQFVHALDKAALTKAGKYTEEQASDLRGVCATGRVYQYEILSEGSVVNSFWTSTCKGSPGTFGASVQQVTSLFSNQIPEKVEYDNQFATPTL